MHLGVSGVEVIQWIDPVLCAGDTVQNEGDVWSSCSSSRFLVCLQKICLWPVCFPAALTVSSMWKMLDTCTWYQMLEKGAGSSGCAEMSCGRFCFLACRRGALLASAARRAGRVWTWQPSYRHLCTFCCPDLISGARTQRYVQKIFREYHIHHLLHVDVAWEHNSLCKPCA